MEKECSVPYSASRYFLTALGKKRPMNNLKAKIKSRISFRLLSARLGTTVPYSLNVIPQLSALLTAGSVIPKTKNANKTENSPLYFRKPLLARCLHINYWPE